MDFQDKQNKLIPRKRSINIKGVLHDFSKAKIMAIINLTPDSFHAASRSNSVKASIEKASKHIEEGADILDIGAYSSRPGATDFSEKEEIERLIPSLIALRKEFPNTLISVDTFRAQVAKEALENAADIINDISAGLLDHKMLETVAMYRAPYVMMHMQGKPQNMQLNPHYEDLLLEMLQYFSKRIEAAKSAGINDIILDPGIGFGKSLAHNYKILKNIKEFEIFGLPLLVGISRKSVVNKVIGTDASMALNGSTVIHTLLAQQGPMIYRVHDVKEMKEVLDLVDFYTNVDTES